MRGHPFNFSARKVDYPVLCRGIRVSCSFWTSEICRAVPVFGQLGGDFFRGKAVVFPVGFNLRIRERLERAPLYALWVPAAKCGMRSGLPVAESGLITPVLCAAQASAQLPHPDAFYEFSSGEICPFTITIIVSAIMFT